MNILRSESDVTVSPSQSVHEDVDDDASSSSSSSGKSNRKKVATTGTSLSFLQFGKSQSSN
jgi:hypothetical protein